MKETVESVTERRSWDELLQLLASCYLVISEERHTADRLSVLEKIVGVRTRWLWQCNQCSDRTGQQ